MDVWKIFPLVFLGNNIKLKLSGKALGLQLCAQILSANKIAGFFKMSYLKEEVNDELSFWHADQHQNPLQVDIIILVVYTQACPSYPK